MSYKNYEYLSGPVIEQLLGVEFVPEAITVSFKFLSFHVAFPSFAQHILYTAQVCCQLALNLFTFKVNISNMIQQMCKNIIFTKGVEIKGTNLSL